MKHDQDHDQALLMLAVGESTGLSRLRSEAHLITCQKCQSRLFELQSVSSRIAGSIAGANALPAVPISLAAIKLKLAALALGIMIFAGVVVGVIIVHENASHPPIQQLHCRPGIASDRCQ